MNPLIPGFGLIFLAAVSGGAIGLPLRMRRRYGWENAWFVAFIFAVVIFPLITVSAFVPLWPSAIRAAGAKTLLTAMVFGFLWGWGTITFAIGVATIGMSLAVATIMGISTVVGSVIPMIRRWGEIPTRAKLVVLAGMVVCSVGTAVCGRAGVRRERAAKSPQTGSPSGDKTASRIFVIGLIGCVLSGFLSACANLGFDFADNVAQEALQLGVHPLSASIVRWIPVYCGGFLAILIGCGSTMIAKGTWRNFVGPGSGHDFGFAVLMACFHFLAQIPYGMGAYYLGHLGTTVGWVANSAIALLVANALGLIMGEWVDAPRPLIRTLYLGLGTLVASMIVLAYGNSLGSH
jgi:L-rhamnose-H+ transport protein